MKKLFENWRKYLNEAETDRGPNLLDDAEAELQRQFDDADAELDTTAEDERILAMNIEASREQEARDNWPQIKAEYEGHYLRFRKKFIKTVLVDRRDSLAKIFKKDTEKNKVSLPVTFLIKELTNFLKNVKLTLMLGYAGGKPDPNRDPDRNYTAGPAFYDERTGIHFEDFLNQWYKDPTEGPGWSYESVVYHELGHAMEHGLRLALRKASKIKSKIDDPSVFDISLQEWKRYMREVLGVESQKGGLGKLLSEPEPEPEKERARISIEQYKKLLTIAPELKDKFSYDYFHKQLAWEFYANLKAFTARLERELIPLDIQMYCAGRRRRYTAGYELRDQDWDEYKNLLEEWYEFLPTKLKKIIDDAHDDYIDNIDAANVSDRTKRRAWFDKVAKLANKTYNQAQFLAMLDCDKDPNYIVQVLRSIY